MEDDVANSTSAQINQVTLDFDTQNENKSKSNKIDEKLINGIVELIFKAINEEKQQKTTKKNILKNLKDNDITLRQLYNWLKDDQSEPDFIFLLGYFNYFGIGTNGNKKEAFNLFNKASKRGHILAQYYVGLCYESGSGTLKNEKLSFDYYKELADKGHALGQIKIGYFYYKKIGTEKNLKEAFSWYEKAANNENSLAMLNLSKMYKIEGNIDKAIYWCNQSIEQGNQDAPKFLEKLNGKNTFSIFNKWNLF